MYYHLHYDSMINQSTRTINSIDKVREFETYLYNNRENNLLVSVNREHLDWPTLSF
jgi:hypothetical protein